MLVILKILKLQARCWAACCCRMVHACLLGTLPGSALTRWGVRYRVLVSITTVIADRRPLKINHARSPGLNFLSLLLGLRSMPLVLGAGATILDGRISAQRSTAN